MKYSPSNDSLVNLNFNIQYEDNEDNRKDLQMSFTRYSLTSIDAACRKTFTMPVEKI